MLGLNREISTIDDDRDAFFDDAKVEVEERTRYWEIDPIFRCHMVGMGLTSREQNQLLKKSGISVKRKSPYEIHETLIGSCQSENRLSRKIDALLGGKTSYEMFSYSLRE